MRFSLFAKCLQIALHFTIPKAKELFYVEKSAEEFSQDNSSLDSKLGAAAAKKAIRLEECLELYTSKEKLGEDDAW